MKLTQQELSVQQIGKWQVNENNKVVLAAPMSPMLAAKDFVKKSFEKENMLLTGLYRLSGKNAPTFTTWEHADIYPTQLDVICAVLNLRHFVVFGEIGSRYMPIALVLDGDAQFSELYTEYNWVSAPTIEDIAKAIEQIDLAALRSELDNARWKSRAGIAEDWYLEQPIQTQIDILGAANLRDTLPLWNALSDSEKWELYNKWKKK